MGAHRFLATIAIGAVAAALPASSAAAASHGRHPLPRAVHSSHAAKSGHAHLLTSFALAGTVTAVDPAASSLTFTVHGGRVKALRGTELTVHVTASTSLRRNGEPAHLAAVVAGDHVTTRGSITDSTYEAKRLFARGDSTADHTATTEPEPTSSPEPTESAEPSASEDLS